MEIMLLTSSNFARVKRGDVSAGWQNLKHDSNVKHVDGDGDKFLYLATSGMGHVEAPAPAFLFYFSCCFPHFKVTDVKSGMPNLGVEPPTSNYSY